MTSLQTGGGVPLASSEEVLQLEGKVNPAIVFNFGFVTDEVLAPNVFLDAFTVTIQDAMESLTAVLATLDVGGAVWAPPTPGTVDIAESQIQRQPIAPPSLSPVNGQGMAYAVRWALPAQFTGPTVHVWFDLYDNQNEAMSLGWYSGVEVISVPEPQIWALLGLGFLIHRLSRRS